MPNRSTLQPTKRRSLRVALSTLPPKLGRAEEVDVKTTPPDPRVETCISHATRGLQWDISPTPGRVTAHY